MGRSIARFGDGELKIATGRDAKSQQHNHQLSAALCRILHDMNGPCLPCIPRPASIPESKAVFWRPYMTAREYLRLYRPDGCYGSAFVTRPDSAPSIDNAGYWESVRKLWAGRDVVLVRGSTKSLTADRLGGAASVTEIVGPVQHAWREHADLFARLKREKSRQIILCLGATATVLASWLAHEGAWALDLGHLGMFTKRIGADGTVGAGRRNDKD